VSTIQIKLSDASSEIKRAMNKGLSEVRKAVVTGCYASLQDLIKASPVDTGLFAQSWGVTEEEFSVFIGNFAPHAPIIEFGARPFRPPIGPLLAWAKRVLKDPSQPGDYSSQVWGLAKYTQAKIETQGMEPKTIMRNNLDQILENIKTELKAIK
jgi:hypothetical protein